MNPKSIPALKIIRPGIYSAIQDFGRFGFRHLGVPCSGASDRQSMMYVNFILHNPNNSPVLEIFGQGIEVETLNPVTIAISGGSAFVTVDSTPTDISKPVKLSAGQRLKIEKLLLGAVVYLGIRGGFTAEPIMGSVSTIHGSHLRPLSKNEIVYAIDESEHTTINRGNLTPIKIDISKPIRVTIGPEFEFLDSNAQLLLLTSTFTITKDSSRMGYRLKGERLRQNNPTDMLTSAVAPGVIQLLPDGQLIILMRDCQTTGGYPRVLVVSESDINQLAHRSPGNSVIFKLNHP